MKFYNTLILKKIVITLSFWCYLITCGFVPYYYDEATKLCYGDGLFNLFFGWVCFIFPGIFTKIYSLAWFSNITYIVTIRYLIKENRRHFILWICITIILSSLLIICPRTEIDDWGTVHHFTLTIGYYLKNLSFFILFTGGIYILFEQNSKNGNKTINKEKNRNRFCHICGYKLGFSPWGEDGNNPSYEICPCCGAEFGCDDYTSKSIKAYREKWIKSGAKWFNPSMKPDNWDLKKQLNNCINITKK